MASRFWLVAWLGLGLQAARGQAPEQIYGGGTPLHLARNSTHLFAALQGLGIENCQIDDSTRVPVLVRISLENPQQVDVLVRRCVGFISALAADEDHVFYRDADAQLKRKTVDGVNITGTLVQENTGTSGIAIDDTHVYWSQRDGATGDIRRKLKVGGGDVEVLGTFDNRGRSVGTLLVDATHVYWAEGAVDSGAVRRMPKNGGSVELLAGPGDGLAVVKNLAGDASFLYCGDSDGQLYRIPRSGGVDRRYIANPRTHRAIESVVVDGPFLIWAETDGGYEGRIRRLGLTQGQIEYDDATDLQILSLTPRNLLAADGTVYWGQFEAIFRTPVNSDGVALDFSIEGVEVTQGLQNLPDRFVEGDVPLVSEKLTWVRVIPQVDYPENSVGYAVADGVTAILRGFRQGEELPESPLSPVLPEIRVRRVARKRGHFDRTFNFVLPRSWTLDQLTLEAEINPGPQIPEFELFDNSRRREVNFLPAPDICLALVPIRANGDTPDVLDDTMQYTIDLLGILFPTSRIHRVRFKSTGKWNGEDFELPGDGSEILNRLAYMAQFSDISGRYCNQSRVHFVGVLEPPAPAALGKAKLGEPYAWFYKFPFRASLKESTSQYLTKEYGSDALFPNSPAGALVLAHELGHNYGRRHVDCGNPDNPDENYPYGDCEISDLAPDQDHWGFYYPVVNTFYNDDWAFVNRRMNVRPVMSYGEILWISDYTYRAILEATTGVDLPGVAKGARVDADPISLTDDVLTLAAIVGSGEDGQGTEITASQVLPAGPFHGSDRVELFNATRERLVARGDEFSVALLDGQGTVLGETFFAPSGEADGDSSRSFVLPMAFDPDTVEIELRRGGSVLDAITVHDGPLAVQVISPNGGETIPSQEGLAVSWSARVVGGQPQGTTYDVFYSPDGGLRWTVLAQGLQGFSYAPDGPGAIPGSSEALVRVVATYRGKSVYDDSDGPFSLGNRPPEPYISSPRPGEVLGHPGSIILRGGAVDAEENSLEEDQLGWAVDGTPVGFGEEMVVDDLPVGRHTASLRGVDSGGLGAEVEVEFFVARKFCTLSNHKVEILFLVESSPEMGAHESTLCTRIASVVGILEELGLDVESSIVGVPDSSDCAELPLKQIDPETEVGLHTAWHLAIDGLARRYAWKDDHTRVLVPCVTDMPIDPSSSALSDLLRSSTGAAMAAGVHVAPWQLPPLFPDLAEFCRTLADSTGGKVLDWTLSDEGVAFDLHEVKARNGCPPEIDAIIPAGPVTCGRRILLVGRNIKTGAQVLIGAKTVPHVAPEGGAGDAISVVCPPDLPTGERFAVRVSIPGGGETEIPGGVEIAEASLRKVNRSLQKLELVVDDPSLSVFRLGYAVSIRAEGALSVDWRSEIALSVNGRLLTSVDVGGNFVSTPDGQYGEASCEGECPPGYEGVVTSLGCMCRQEFTIPVSLTTRPGDEITLRISARPESEPDAVALDDEITYRVPAPGEAFIRGDGNDDGVIDISDPVFNLEHQFLGIHDPGCLSALDTNGDGAMDISDPIFNLEHQFLGQPAPPPPYPDCGPESLPPGEALGCESRPASCP